MAATAMTVFATPAFASMVIQSYMSADVGVVSTCLVTKAGSDVGSYNDPNGANVEFATNSVSNTRVLIEEDQLTVFGMSGDRVIYNDVARIQNDCDMPLTVSLKMEGSQGANWTDRFAEVYLSSTPAAIDSTTALGFPTDSTGNWTGAPLQVDSNGTPIQDTTTAIEIDPGEELRVATLIEAGTTASSLGVTSTMSWEVNAVNSNGN